MNSEIMYSALLLFAAASVILPLLTVAAVKGLEKRIRYGACYLILLLCAVRILIPTGWGIPTLFSVSPSSEWRTEATTQTTATGDSVFVSPSVTVPDVGGPSGSDLADTVSEGFLEGALEQAWTFIVTHPIEMLLLLWGLGSLTLFLVTVLPQLTGMRRERRMSLPVSEDVMAVYLKVCRERGVLLPPAIRRLEAPISPHLSGVLRPVIYLGSTPLEERELACVLRHELTHYRRCDLL